MTEDDLRLMYEAERGTDWRLNGAVPTFEDYRRIATENVELQLVVVSNSGLPLGWVGTYNVDMRNGICYLFVSAFARRADPAFFDGARLFVDHIFLSLPIRKMYFETDDPKVDRLATSLTPGLLQEEGRLRDHVYRRGDYSDRVTYSLRRETWERSLSSFTM